jgi:CubicO group peptidase (beta-lactamase class C family)
MKLSGKTKKIIGKRPKSKPRFRRLPKGLTEAKVRRHVIYPAHIRDILIEEVDEAKEVRYEFRPVTKKFKGTPNVDLGAFGLAVHTILKDSVVGYMLQIRQHGNLVFLLMWNWAQTPADQGKGWNEDTRMHVASVSKFLTGVGLVKSLASKGISYDAKMIDYLPAHWSKGQSIGQITFRHLLTHRSGFDSGPSSNNSNYQRTDYTFMKDKVADGVSNVGSITNYENMNFGLCRILIPVINNKINKNAVFISDPVLNDQAWDAVTLYHYKNYMQAKIFTPAGVNNATFEPLAGGKNALAYPFPPDNTKGWDSGDLATVAGGAGWRLSTKELLNVLNHVRRKNTIISKQRAQYMLDNNFGIDQVIPSPGGTLYNKNGGWEEKLDRTVRRLLSP